MDRKLKKIGDEIFEPQSLRLCRTLQRVEARAETVV